MSTYSEFKNIEHIRRTLENGHTGDIYYKWNNPSSPPTNKHYINKIIDLLRTYPNFYIRTCSINHGLIRLIPYIDRIRDGHIELDYPSYEILEELRKYLPNCPPELNSLIICGDSMSRESISILRDALHASPHIKKLSIPAQEFYPDGLFKTLTGSEVYFDSQQAPRLAKILRNSKLEEVFLTSYFATFTTVVRLIQGLPPTIKEVQFYCPRLSYPQVQQCHWYLMRHPNYTVSWRYWLKTRLNKIILISRILPPGLFRQFITIYSE